MWLVTNIRESWTDENIKTELNHKTIFYVILYFVSELNDIYTY